MKTTEFTTERVRKIPQGSMAAEFGRWQDVQHLFGIKRGTLYNLVAEGKVRSISLRRRGRAYGCRLFYLQSVREYLQSLMETQDLERVGRDALDTTAVMNLI